MGQLANVVIVMSRCGRRKEGFGIRFEEMTRGVWSADWAFPVQERLAKKEGYDHNEIRGQIGISEAYPGCPYCNEKGLFLCSRCDKVACYDNSSNMITCPWCALQAQVGSESVTGLKAGDDL